MLSDREVHHRNVVRTWNREWAGGQNQGEGYRCRYRCRGCKTNASRAARPELRKQCSGAPSERCKVLFSSAQLSPSLHHEQTPRVASALMSHSHSTASSSNNFQLILNNALEAYKKRTKQDLLAHPFASQLQPCDSPGAILAVLQQQVQGLDQSRSSDDRLTRWLDPTVNVLYALSATLGERVGLVSLRIRTFLEICTHIIYIDRYSRP